MTTPAPMSASSQTLGSPAAMQAAHTPSAYNPTQSPAPHSHIPECVRKLIKDYLKMGTNPGSITALSRALRAFHVEGDDIDFDHEGNR